MQIVDYRIDGSILTVGFKEDSFVVYSSIPYNESRTKEELLQQAYIGCRSAIEYEKTLTTHGFTTEEVGEEFIPEKPRASKLSVDFNSLTGDVLDQYGEIFEEGVVEFSIEGTDNARIEDGTIIEDVVGEDTIYFVAASYEDLVEKQERIIYAPKPDRIAELQNIINNQKQQLLDVQEYIIEQEYEKLLSQGGM